MSKPSTIVEFPFVQAIPTRWKDNDIYGHVNNVEYYSFFDTLINSWLIEHAHLDIYAGEVIGVCAESSCRFLRSIAFPDVIKGGLRVGHLGTTSVKYEICLFAENSGDLIAEGWFVHVFVSRRTRKPEPIRAQMREALKTLIVARSE